MSSAVKKILATSLNVLYNYFGPTKLFSILYLNF